MNTNHYVAEFTNKDGKFDFKKSKDFNEALKLEFIERCKEININDDEKRYQKAVEQMRQKFDNISKKIAFGIPEQVWNYFYGSVVCDLREVYIPSYMKRQEEMDERIYNQVKQAFKNFRMPSLNMELCTKEEFEQQLTYQRMFNSSENWEEFFNTHKRDYYTILKWLDTRESFLKRRKIRQMKQEMKLKQAKQ